MRNCRKVGTVAALLLCLILPGCGNLGATGGHRAQFLVTLSSLSPSNVTAGGPPFMLTVNGSNLGPDCNWTLVWNGGTQINSTAPATCQGTQAFFLINASLIQNAGSASIALVDGINANQLSNPLTLTVAPRTSTACALFGLYHYVITGFDNNGPMMGSGAFGVDASGNATGEYNFNDRFYPFYTQNIPGDPSSLAGGKCTNGSTPNQGTVTLSAGPTAFNYTFAVQQGGNGRLVESDPAVQVFDGTAYDVAGSGVFAKVVPDQTFSGNYVFGMVGADPYGNNGNWTQIAVAGNFAFSSAALNGVADLNDGGTVISDAILGPTPQQIPVPADPYSIASFPVNIGTLPGAFTLMMTTPSNGLVVGGFPPEVLDPGFVGNPGYTSGINVIGVVTSQEKAGAYDNGGLNASLVLSTLGAPPPLCCTTSTNTTLGLASGFDSNSGTFNLLFDNVSGGVANLNQTVTGATYSVAGNGRATVSYTSGGEIHDYVYYLDNVNDGYIVGLDNSAEFGFFQPQASGPFNTGSANGTFAAGTFLPLTPGSPNLATEVTLNNGNLTASAPSGALSGTYSVTATGRGTATVSPPVLGGNDLVLYVIDPQSVLLMGSDNMASDTIMFMHF